MPVARATSTTQHLGSTSILVPRHFQLEAPRAKYPCQVIGGAFSFMPQVIAKWLHGTLHKNLETPARHTGPRSNICENQARAIPNHTSKPLPLRLSQVPRRPHSPPCYCRDRVPPRWCWPCNASPQRPHNAADNCTHAVTQRCTSVVKSLHTENAM